MTTELDVILKTIEWLENNQWVISVISIPNNQKLSKNKQIEIIHSKLEELNIDVNEIKFDNSGADIIALKNKIEFRIECKGIGVGVIQTQKNSFDRAVASTVSYYTKNENLQIGIALPKTENNVNFVRKKFLLHLEIV